MNPMDLCVVCEERQRSLEWCETRIGKLELENHHLKSENHHLKSQLDLKCDEVCVGTDLW